MDIRFTICTSYKLCRVKCSLSISGTTATLGGIKPGVTYSFSVVAKKGTGTSPAIGASFTAPGGTPDAN
ncbi:Penicillin-binding protein [Bacillus thuringiensis serovar israelensis ATCC 35646]|nr:Penicillin-binding protein [Bacillus thuringiensis serovar israelensis ATCC 35646]